MNLSTYSTEVGLLPATTDFLDEILRHATFQYSVHNAASLEGTLCKNLDQGYIKINGPLKGKFLLGSRALSSFFSSSIRALPSFPFPQFLFHISSHPQFHHFLYCFFCTEPSFCQCVFCFSSSISKFPDKSKLSKEFCSEKMKVIEEIQSDEFLRLRMKGKT